MRKGEREIEEEMCEKEIFLKIKKITNWNISNEIGKENENQSEKYKKREQNKG